MWSVWSSLMDARPNNKTTSNSSDGENISLTELNYCGTQQPGLNSSPDLRLAQPPDIEQISRASWSNRRPTVLLRFSDQVSTIDMSEHSAFLSPATSPHKEPSPLLKRRRRAVLTREQAIEVYRLNLTDEGPSTGGDSRITANAAAVARRSSNAPLHNTHAELLFPPSRTPSRPLPK